MDNQTQAQLYFADQRGLSQADYFRSFHSFNVGSYVDKNRQPFGSLRLVNDDTLMAGRSINMHVDEHTDVIIFPVVGGLGYTSQAGDGFLEAGQVLILSLTPGMDYEISNPYETELINFIQIWLTNKSDKFSFLAQQLSFDLTDKNKLLPLFFVDTNSNQRSGFIGIYDGRNDGVYYLKNSADEVNRPGVFVFVLSGVFEVQNRLLHERDGMALWHVQDAKVAFEALSNDAILLLLELPV